MGTRISWFYHRINSRTSHQWRFQKIQEAGDFFKNWVQVPSKCFYVEEQVILVVKSSSIKQGVLYIMFWIKKTTQKGINYFLNLLIQTNSFIIKVLARSFIILNTMMENESKSFTNTFIFPLRSCLQVMVIIVFSIVFNMMKLLAILLQIKAGQNYD